MGVTFVEAVRRKYEYKKGEEDPGGDLVGGEKTGRQQAVETLTRVFLADSDIEDPGADGEIAAVCGAIQELDLEANALSSWAPVLTIAAQLPQLRVYAHAPVQHARAQVPWSSASGQAQLRVLLVHASCELAEDEPRLHRQLTRRRQDQR